MGPNVFSDRHDLCSHSRSDHCSILCHSIHVWIDHAIFVVVDRLCPIPDRISVDRDMSRKARRLIIISSFIIVGLCALFWGLVYAKGFLAPIAVAALLTMLVLPISQWLEQKGVKRGWAAL